MEEGMDRGREDEVGLSLEARRKASVYPPIPSSQQPFNSAFILTL